MGAVVPGIIVFIGGNGMGIPSYDRMEGSDHVVGTYKGLSIEMSDVTLIKEDETIDEEGNREKSDRVVF